MAPLCELAAAMVLHRVVVKKDEKTACEKLTKQKSKQLRKKQGPKPRDEQLKCAGVSIGKTVGNAMSEKTRQQAW